MGLVGAVIRVGVLWVISVLGTIAGLELAHRMALATDRGAIAETRENGRYFF
jgi:hypothetical protein